MSASGSGSPFKRREMDVTKLCVPPRAPRRARRFDATSQSPLALLTHVHVRTRHPLTPPFPSPPPPA